MKNGWTEEGLWDIWGGGSGKGEIIWNINKEYRKCDIFTQWDTTQQLETMNIENKNIFKKKEEKKNYGIQTFKKCERMNFYFSVIFSFIIWEFHIFLKIFLFSIFFVYIPNDFPFPGSPLPICP